MTGSENTQYAVQLRGVTKAFGRTPVLRGIDLDVPWGQALSLVGPNGSGKTTLIKALATLTRCDSGQIAVAGLRPDRAGARIRRLVGVVAHDPLLYDDLTGRENLRFFCRMFGLDQRDERVARVTALMGMTARADQKVGAMSHGMKKRFSIARALLHDPPLLLLDEPESGLDHEALALLDAALSDRADPRRTIIMTTHNLDRAVALGDRIVVLSEGRIAYDNLQSAQGDADAARDAYLRHTGTPR